MSCFCHFVCIFPKTASECGFLRIGIGRIVRVPVNFTCFEMDNRVHLKFSGRKIPLPGSPLIRVLLGILLVVGGILGFLPVLGFWMIPLGIIVLSIDLPFVRRFRRQVEVRVLRWWRARKASQN